MAKDYAKYTMYRKERSQRSRLWMMLGFSIGLFILGLGLFFFKSHHNQKIEQQTESKLKQKIVETPAPKPPEPKFDFYNILPQGALSSASQLANDATLSNAQAYMTMTHDATSVSPHLKKPLAGLMNTTPEQVAMAEAKKQLDQEMSQLSNDAYILVLGNFEDVSQAEQYQAQALLKGFPVQSKINEINGRVIYQLFIGPYSGLALASQQEKRLNTAGMVSVLVKLSP